MSTGTVRAASAIVPVAANGLIASTPAGAPRAVEVEQPEREREPAALREAAEDRLAPVEAELRALLVDQRVELGERVGPLVRPDSGRPNSYHMKPGVPGAASGARGSTTAKLAVGVEVRHERAEVALVGAVPVHEQQQPLRAPALDDVGDQRHGAQPTRASVATSFSAMATVVRWVFAFGRSGITDASQTRRPS